MLTLMTGRLYLQTTPLLGGLNFGAPQAWTGKATTATRATSANGMWLLPRDVQKWDLDAAGSQGRPDYAGQFKANDGDKYLFALKATSKNNGEVVKSPVCIYIQSQQCKRN